MPMTVAKRRKGGILPVAGPLPFDAGYIPVIRDHLPAITEPISGGRPEPIAGAPLEREKNFWHMDPAFVVPAGLSRVVAFRDLLGGKDAQYIRITPDAQITMRLKTVDESRFQTAILPRLKAFWISGLTYTEMVLDNTTGAAAVTLDTLFASKPIQAIQEQNVSIIVESPVMDTPLTVVMALLPAPVSASTAVKRSCLFRAADANVGIISLGDVTAVVPLLWATQTVAIDMKDLSTVYASSTIAGDILTILITQ